MVLDRILHSLNTPSLSRRRAIEQGRLAFLEWLWSLPEGTNFATQALADYERADRSGLTSPAITVFCGLLVHASRPMPMPVRRGGARARRMLH